MTTNWKFRVFLLVRKELNVPGVRTLLGKWFADNGSGQTEAQERAGWEAGNLTKWERANKPGVLFAYSIETAAKPAMRDAFAAFVAALDDEAASQSLPSPYLLWVAFTNTAFNSYEDGEIVLNSFNPAWNGLVFTHQGMEAWLLSNWNLQPLTEAGP